MFRGSGGIAVRGIHHHNAFFARGRNIDIIETDARPPDNLQPMRRFEQVGGDPGGAADHQTFVLTDDFFQLLRRKSGFYVHFQA